MSKQIYRVSVWSHISDDNAEIMLISSDQNAALNQLYDFLRGEPTLSDNADIKIILLDEQADPDQERKYAMGAIYDEIILLKDEPNKRRPDSELSADPVIKIAMSELSKGVPQWVIENLDLAYTK
ncbi:hypothetical protein [Pedobacter sp.]|uniref:hypothetical protein n=1 Tax=Pedobacter sp. TaxID=1411316 RepID=UPI003D7F759F